MKVGKHDSSSAYSKVYAIYFYLKVEKAYSSTCLEIKETRRKYHINGNVCLSFLDVLKLPLYHECRGVVLKVYTRNKVAFHFLQTLIIV